MQHLGKRAGLLVALGLLAIPVTAAGIAYACTALATLSTSTSSAVAGATVTVSGKYFAPHDATDIRTSPAIVHFDQVDGPAIASVSPSSGNTSGTFAVNVTVPAASPGEHVIIVTQNGSDGKPAYGTPARAVITVEPTPVTVVLPPAPAALPPLATFPTVTPVTTESAPAKKTMAQKIASCKSKYKASAAKTSKGRRSMARKRAACIRAASAKS